MSHIVSRDLWIEVHDLYSTAHQVLVICRKLPTFHVITQYTPRYTICFLDMPSHCAAHPVFKDARIPNTIRISEHKQTTYSDNKLERYYYHFVHLTVFHRDVCTIRAVLGLARVLQ